MNHKCHNNDNSDNSNASFFVSALSINSMKETDIDNMIKSGMIVEEVQKT